MDQQWEILNLGFCSRLGDSLEERQAESLLGGFGRTGNAAGAEVRFSLEKEAGRTTLVLEEARREPRRLRLGSSPAEETVFLLISEAIDRTRDKLILHSACLAGAAGSCLAIGPAGAGKTTLCLLMWCEGLDVVSDDITPISHDALRPEVFPRAFHLDNPLPELLRDRIPPRPAAFPEFHYPFPGREETAVRGVDTILELERVENGSEEVEPLTKSEAAHVVLKAAIKPRGFSYEKALRTAMELAATARAFRLRPSSVQSLRDQALELLT